MHDCDKCKYDPRYNSKEVINSIIVKRGYVYCCHPEAYKNGEANDEFWSKNVEYCYSQVEKL